MNQKDALVRLRKETEINPAINAALHVFALRKRARSRITVLSLARTMQKEKFSFSAAQYQDVLRVLADTGFGQLEKDAKGKIRALKDIKVTFKSLGTAVVSPQESNVKPFRPRTRYSKVLGEALPEAVEQTRTMLATKHPVLGLKVSLRFMIHDKPIDLQVPDSLTSDEIGILVSKLRNSG